MVQVHLKRSKCDQFGSRSDIVVGRTDANICPVQAIVDYVAKRGDKPGPFFTITLSQPVTKSWFVAQFRAILSAVGLPQFEYAGHSFHIGAATTAALVGMEDSTIQALGRCHSTAFLQYIRMAKHKLAAMPWLVARHHRCDTPVTL